MIKSYKIFEKIRVGGLNIEDLSDIYAKIIANDYNTEVVKKIGYGSYGIAYLLRNNKVLKITRDKREVISAIDAKRRNLDFVVEYYDIYKIAIPGTEDIDYKIDDVDYLKTNLYFLIQEYIKPLSRLERNMINRIVKYSDTISIFRGHSKKLTHRFWSSLPIEMKSYSYKYLASKYLKLIKKIIKTNLVGIDTNLNNVGWKNDELYFYDISYQIDTREYKIEEVEIINYSSFIKYLIISNYEQDEEFLFMDAVKLIAKSLGC
jgi:hypothetical protein